MAALRILLTTDTVGGVWQYSLELARGLARLDIETAMAVIGPSPSDAHLRQARSVPQLKLIDTGCELDWLAEDYAAVARAGRTVARIARECDADLVQLNTPALAADAEFRQPVVAVQHSCLASWWEAVRGTALPADFEWRTRLVRAGLHAADAVVAPTSAFAQTTRLLYALPATPRTVHNGRTPLPLPLPAHPEPDFVFTAGRLWDEGKNLATLDAAAERLGVPILAAGPVRGPNGAEVPFRNLRCLGNLDEPELGRRLGARPIFVSAALYEPFGLSVLEAASAGCPLVVSDIPTFRELWEGAAIFVPPRNERGFAEAIFRLVEDDTERAAHGQAAKARAARYTPDAMAAQMASIYHGLLPAVRRPMLTAAQAVGGQEAA
jgi:glycosyltransferase involved in cell wall biosynthesis